MYLKIIIVFIIVLLLTHSYLILPYHTDKFNNISDHKNKLIIENYYEGMNDQQVGRTIVGQSDHIVDTFKWIVLFGRDLVFNIIPNYTWITRYYDKKNDWVRANKGLPPLLPSELPKNSKIDVIINRDDSDFKIGSSGRSLMNMML